MSWKHLLGLGVSVAYQIAFAETFPLELGRAPKKVQHAYQRSVLPLLKEGPDQADPPKVRPLRGYRDLWRLRVSDEYRLVYQVDRKARVVTLLMVDHRNKIYDRLGLADDGGPGARILAQAGDLLEREPTPEEVGRAIIDYAAQQERRVGSAPDRPLPLQLDAGLLGSWGIPEKHHQTLAGAKTEGDLLGLEASGLPQDVLERVLNGLWPPAIEEVFQQPVRLAPEPAEIGAAADGDRSIESFLLRLDEDQKAFVSRFEGRGASGPWLLKGGPGSGKSTVALYCMRSLVREASGRLQFDDEPLRILFTTYTKSLVHASSHLLDALGLPKGNHKIDVKTVYALAYRYQPESSRELHVCTDRESEPLAAHALHECHARHPGFSFSLSDIDFLLQEINWVLVGQGINTVDEYLQADRTGRGRALPEASRRQVWSFWESFRRHLREKNLCLFSEPLLLAERCVTPVYDFVFIDEAQDLTIAAVRLCIGLCRNRSNVFLTADTNQSIYGKGLSWSRVAAELRFQGRARILRRNYRTTAEIWSAIKQLAPDTTDADSETLDVETVFRGPFPLLVFYDTPAEVGPRLNSFLHEALRAERVTPGCAAVLCRTLKEMDGIMDLLAPSLNARKMQSSEVDLAHPGVKVLTMHAAKGLQFPVVAVVGVKARSFPGQRQSADDSGEHQAQEQRILFVACSRAMRRLAVFASRSSPSDSVRRLTDEAWEVEGRKPDKQVLAAKGSDRGDGVLF